MGIGPKRMRLDSRLEHCTVARYHSIMNAETPGKLSKFQRYRARRKAAGFKEVRLWVRDPNTPEFKAEMTRAAIELRGSKSEREALEFIWTAMEDTMKDEPY
jgi:Protein  of unknown function (DUF3018)